MIEELGQYRMLERMGSGPHGEVYRARDTRVGRTVAIKVLSDEIAAVPGRRGHFLRAARIAAALSHPNIAALYHVGDEGDRLYLACEFVEGQTLKSTLGGRPINPRRAIDLAGQIAEALAVAHAAGVAHGDISTTSVVVTPKGHVKILDFGLASSGPAGSDRAPVAPSDRSDLSALGAMLFEMLTGAPPVRGAQPPSLIVRAIPRELDPVVAKAIGEDGRYESAAALAADLRAVAAVLDARRMKTGPSASPSIGAIRTPQRSNVPWLLLALLAGAALVAAWWYVRPG